MKFSLSLWLRRYVVGKMNVHGRRGEGSKGFRVQDRMGLFGKWPLDFHPNNTVWVEAGYDLSEPTPQGPIVEPNDINRDVVHGTGWEPDKRVRQKRAITPAGGCETNDKITLLFILFRDGRPFDCARVEYR